jgi:hypothetical protein
MELIILAMMAGLAWFVWSSSKGSKRQIAPALREAAGWELSPFGVRMTAADQVEQAREIAAGQGAPVELIEMIKASERRIQARNCEQTIAILVAEADRLAGAQVGDEGRQQLRALEATLVLDLSGPVPAAELLDEHWVPIRHNPAVSENVRRVVSAAVERVPFLRHRDAVDRALRPLIEAADRVTKGAGDDIAPVDNWELEL